jgi:5'-deoxynucleotidase YfbR-like HD superfamily hydrolase
MTGTTPAAKWPPTTTMNAPGLFWPLLSMAKLAMRFGRIDRTAVRHADGVTRESDSDHTVMLGWLAPALAARCADDLDVGLVAQFALVHDAPEVLAGDTQTLRITAGERVAKAQREEAAADTLARMFGASLPWFPEMILRYERQGEPEARFVKAVDKLVVKLVHLIDRCAGIREENVSAGEFVAMAATQRVALADYAGDFPGLLELHAVLCGEVEARLRELELPQGVPGNAAAMAVSKEDSGHVDYVCPGEHDDGGWSCQFCAGGLFSCTRCGSFEGATTTHCPGRQMTGEEHDAVYAGELDFRSGQWVRIGSPHTPNRGWVLSGAFECLDESGTDGRVRLEDALDMIDGGDFIGGIRALRREL